MKFLYSALSLGLGLLLPLEASAALTCQKIAQGPSSPEACRADINSDKRMRERRPAVYKMYSTATSELCKSASSAAKIDNHRCEDAVDKLKGLLDERKQKMLGLCDQIAEQVNACQRCQTNLSAAGCQQEDIKINQKFASKGREMMAKRRELMQAAKDVENEMFQLSEDYGENLAELQGDMMTNKKTSPAAAEIGASSISEGLSKHGNASPAEIFRAVEQFRNQQEVSSSDIQEAQSIESQYARESLSRALEAKAARLEMQKENSQDSSGLQSLDTNTQTVSKSTTQLASVDPAASQSGLGGATTANAATAAGGGLAGLGAMGAAPTTSGTAMADPGYTTPQVAGNTYGGGTYNPTSRAGTSGEMLNGIANASANTTANAVQDIAAADQETAGDEKANTSSASRMPVRDSLRAKLAERLAQGGKGVATGASQAEAGKAGSPEEKMKARAKSNPDMLAGFQAADFTAAGGAGSFSMAQSETEAAVKEMMTEFEGELGDEPGFGGVRHLASVGDRQSAPEILSEDSSDLFLRTREFYERCQRRGCVTR